MNKIKIVLCIVTVTILGVLLPVYSNPEIVKEEHGNITVINVANDPIRLAQEFDELSVEEKLKLLKNPDTMLPVYLISIADLYYSAGKKDYGLFLYLLGSLRAFQDISMCEDFTAKAQMQIYPMLASDTVKYMFTVDNKKLVKIAKSVAKWDKEHPTRPNPVWACYHGMFAFAGNVTTKPMSEYPKIQKKHRKEFIEMIKEMDKYKKETGE